jgi:hypothetical protein
MRWSHRSRALAALLLTLAATPLHAAPDLTGNFGIGPAGGTEQKMQSKLWFNDGFWWALVSDGTGQGILKLENGAFARQPNPNTLADERQSSRADVLWDGTYLYVLLWHPTVPRFSQYSYNSATQTYTRLPGFPITFPIANSNTMVLDKDSTGRLFVSFNLNLAIHVIWSTSADHRQWNTTGIELDHGGIANDKAGTIAFGGNKVGVFYGNRTTNTFAFRVHQDSAPPETWGPPEIVDSGLDHIDDHFNLKAAPDGRVFAVDKDNHNHIHLFVRSVTGAWKLAASDINQGAATRPSLLLDMSNNMLRVFYTDWTTRPYCIRTASAPLASLVFGSPQVYLSSPSGSFLDNVTATKQVVTAETGLAVMANSPASAFWGFQNLDLTPPTAQPVTPLSEQAGVPSRTALQYHVTDAGMGVLSSSITMNLDGRAVVPQISGTLHDYLVSYAPTAPLALGQIHVVTLAAKDRATPANLMKQIFRFRTEMAPAIITRKVNFQPKSGTPPTGYQADWGQVYTLDSGIGWTAGTLSTKRSTNADARLGTTVSVSNAGIATWELDVPNGNYQVTVVCGSTKAGTQRVEFNGAVAINNVSTAANAFTTASNFAVTVRNGQLAMRIGGIAGDKKSTSVCYLDLASAGAGHKADSDAEPLPVIAARMEANPARPGTAVCFAAPAAVPARVMIFDARGRLVRRLFDGTPSGNELRLPWDGRTESGGATPNGIYFVRAQSGAQSAVVKLTFVR